jgi:hypothetical protein
MTEFRKTDVFIDNKKGGSRIKCLKCGDIIQSMYKHDFVWCSCGNVFVDGGNDYFRFGGFDDEKTVEFIDSKTEEEEK